MCTGAQHRGCRYRGSGVHDLARVLRLLCLATLTAGGLRGDDLDEFRTAILQTYGFGAISLLQSLEAAKLLSGDISWRVRGGLMATDWEKVDFSLDPLLAQYWVVSGKRAVQFGGRGLQGRKLQRRLYDAYTTSHATDPFSAPRPMGPKDPRTVSRSTHLLSVHYWLTFSSLRAHHWVAQEQYWIMSISPNNRALSHNRYSCET